MLRGMPVGPVVRSTTAKTSVTQNTVWTATPKAANVALTIVSPMVDPSIRLLATARMAMIGIRIGNRTVNSRRHSGNRAGPMRYRVWSV